MSYRRLLVCLVLSALAGTAAAKSGPFYDETEPLFDVEDPEQWKEGKTEIPPYPSDGDLVEFSVDQPGSSFRYYLDKASMSVGADGIIRYTLVIESKSGSRNVSFEGMQCNESRYKVYAYGSGSSLKSVSAPDWTDVRGVSYDQSHKELYQFYLCDHGDQSAFPPKEVLRRIKQGIPSKNVDFY